MTKTKTERVAIVFAASSSVPLNDLGDYAEDHGFIDPEWSMTTFVELEDARQVIVDRADVIETIERTIGVLDSDDGAGNYYAADARQDQETGAAWTYSACEMETADCDCGELARADLVEPGGDSQTENGPVAYPSRCPSCTD